LNKDSHALTYVIHNLKMLLRDKKVQTLTKKQSYALALWIIFIQMTDIRAKAPRIKKLIRPVLPAVQFLKLKNGIPVYMLKSGSEPVVKLEILFRSGRAFEKAMQASRFTCQMLMEGTISMNSEAISEHFDYYGSSLATNMTMDHTGLTLHCLEKHTEVLFPLLSEILINPQFPELELAKAKKNAKERLLLDLSKNDFVAYRELTTALFGSKHPYGYNSDANTIDAIQRSTLQEHFERTHNAQNCIIFISGLVSERTLSLLDQYFSEIPQGVLVNPQDMAIEANSGNNFKFPSKNKHQVALRLGKRLFPRNHPDFNSLYVLNTILGGYFGSRLMAQIREEMGYTYNIYSSLDTMLYDGAFIISMETDREFLDESRAQIYQEMKRLCEFEVKKSELNMVRNYLLGYLLTALDGPLHASELIKGLIMEGASLESFDQLVDCIMHISGSDLLTVAQNYLNEKGMTEVIVGL
jgi:zinc protease